ncbi:hypothetical protein [Gloeocapsa sp. PCC 7428]|nr:hypothetical protein [Gloeocapsa sp. PCC 7428]
MSSYARAIAEILKNRFPQFLNSGGCSTNFVNQAAIGSSKNTLM